MIGVFDSGIGGVTVFKEILKEMPNYDYIYYSDSINNPYGDKDKEELIKITEDIVKYLVNSDCKVIVIACNTASAICKEYLREHFSVPIIAIEPAIKQVYDKNAEGKTLLLATKGTMDSEKFRELYNKYNNKMTYLQECGGLADLIEADKKLEIKQYLKEKLEKYKGVENLVLGCTHYPLIIEEFKEVLGDVNIYHGAKGVVKELKRVVEVNKIKPGSGKIKFIDTSKKEAKANRFWQILKD